MDVIGFGLANIDLVARVPERFLIEFGVPKGGDLTTDSLTLGRMRANMPSFSATPGGCVGNTLCGLSAMGIDTRFYGKLGHDEFESLYRTSFRDYGVAYDVPSDDSESAQCAVLITPDGERSFTHVEGTSFLLSEADIDWDLVARAQVLYAEIYVCHFGHSTALFERISETAKRFNIPFYVKVVDRAYGARYKDLLRQHATEGGLTMLVGNQDNLPAVIGEYAPTAIREKFKDWPCAVLMTAAGRGGTFFEGGTARDFTTDILAAPKNSSGAGDQFMAGFIAARLDDKPIDDCLAFGARTARDILMHNQPRPPLSTRQNIQF